MIIMAIIALIIFYGLMWSLFSVTTVSFNDIWEPEDSWKGPDKSIKKENSLGPINKPIKVKPVPSLKVNIKENKNTMPHKKVTVAEANRIKSHMKRFKEKQLLKKKFNGNDTVIEEVPSESIRYGNVTVIVPKGKTGNR